MKTMLMKEFMGGSLGVIFAGVLGFVLCGCAGEGTGAATGPEGDPDLPTGGGSVDFSKQVQPIFNENCSCHLTPSAPQGEVLLEGASYDFLVNVPSTGKPEFMRVKPGDPDNSYLIIKVDDQVPDVGSKRVGERMPRGSPPLSRTEIDTLRKWVEEGALRAAPTGDNVPDYSWGSGG